jgi:hypothetical protein
LMRKTSSPRGSPSTHKAATRLGPSAFWRPTGRSADHVLHQVAEAVTSHLATSGAPEVCAGRGAPGPMAWSQGALRVSKTQWRCLAAASHGGRHASCRGAGNTTDAPVTWGPLRQSREHLLHRASAVEEEGAREMPRAVEGLLGRRAWFLECLAVRPPIRAAATRAALPTRSVLGPPVCHPHGRTFS